MRKINALTFAIVLSAATLMSGQATRTWVSGVGDDANPCSRTAPCKTWAGAISKTAPNGEIDALDPGGFGALTITKPITLDGGGGQVGSTLVSGTNGIVVAAGANDVVIIRNLRINGIRTGLNGISFISGKELSIENCVIFDFLTNGISISLSASGTVHIINSLLKNNGNCSAGGCTSGGTGDGVFATTSSGTVSVTVSNSQIIGSTNNGVEAGSGSHISIDRSVISASGNSGIISGASPCGNVSIEGGYIVNGNNGATAAGGCSVAVSHTTIAYNTGTAYNAPAGGPAKVFAFATGAAAATNSTNVVHDNFVGNATYFVSQ
jgi:hypothetical protein